MKGWYAKHEGKWKKIIAIKDSGKPVHEGGGNMYELEGTGKVHQDSIEDIAPPEDVQKNDMVEGGLADDAKPEDFDKDQLSMGIAVEMEHTDDPKLAREIAMDHLKEDPKYYTKLKEVEKYDRVEVSPDGKRELDYGVEPLDKDPKSRWQKIKKALDASSFLSINDELDSEEEGEEQDVQDQGNQETEVIQDQQPQDQQEEVQDSSEEPAGDESAVTDDQSESMPDADQSKSQEESSPEEALAALEDHLREQGYSDEEIAYIIHDHAPHQPGVDEVKSDKESAMAQLDLDHAQRMKDLEHSQAQFDMETNGLDREHKKKMLDIEYDKARRLAELELEYKRKEMEQKLQQQAEKHKTSLSSRDAKPQVSQRMDAAQVSKKEAKGDE